MIIRKYHKRDKLKTFEEVLERKLESMEIYYVKQVASMVAVNKILNPQLHMESDRDLKRVIVQFIIDSGMNKTIHPSMRFVDEVMEYMYLKAGYLHIKEFLFYEPVPKESKQLSLDELFWPNNI